MDSEIKIPIFKIPNSKIKESFVNLSAFSVNLCEIKK